VPCPSQPPALATLTHFIITFCNVLATLTHYKKWLYNSVISTRCLFFPKRNMSSKLCKSTMIWLKLENINKYKECCKLLIRNWHNRPAYMIILSNEMQILVKISWHIYLLPVLSHLHYEANSVLKRINWKLLTHDNSFIYNPANSFFVSFSEISMAVT
jgi:hypothetical protein